MTFGRITNARGTSSITTSQLIATSTVRSVGEASRKLRRSEALKSTNGEVDSLNVVRFGKTKLFNDPADSGSNSNSSRFTAPLKRRDERAVNRLD